MTRTQRSTIGITVSTALLSAFALVGFAVAQPASALTTGARVKVCLQQRADAGYYNRNMPRAQRLTIQAQFRACVKQTVSMNAGHARSSVGTSSSMSSSSKSSAMRTRTVEIDDFAYEPASITVKKDTRVRWINEDEAPHTITGDASGGPNSGTLYEGDRYSFVFTQTGSFPYHCSFHPHMTGMVTVTE